MRVTDKLRFDIFKNNLAALKEQLDKTQNIIASGKKIMAPSDDPVMASRSVELEAQKNQNDQFSRNLGQLKTLSSFYDTSLTKIEELLTRVKELTVSQSSDNMDASTRLTASEEVKGIIEQLVSIGNSKIGSTYIFGGQRANSVPFALDADYNVTYSGTSDVSSVYVDNTTRENAGISGERVFNADTDIFSSLKTFKEALETNDRSGIQSAMDDIDEALTATEDNLAYVGTYMKRIEDLLADNEVKSNNLTQTVSDMVETDITQAIADFNTLTTTYQGLLYSMARVQELSILNYLK
ncbi:MAG TPA: flagellar hook-associated protein FlgL [Syntrophorhabdaceae bacterium]|nr:flagellar hook-associated protein FlgL [Syntrophorhabdaceae bacterium]